MPTIHVDGRAHEVPAGANLLEALLHAGYDLPYFCWHPALGSVGACRQCAITTYAGADDAEGRLSMACMTPATDGTRLSMTDPASVEARKSVVECLMHNHPHDCPVCDEGGECHLQDMTVMTGHVSRSYRFRKRTFRSQDLGPFLHHEMNRCIQCYRCVRYYTEHAGGRDLAAFASHDHTWFGRHEDGPLESPFSGNLVEVCPTGVFTDETQHHHFARKWDLSSAPSVCVHCSVGCGTAPGARLGRLRRVRNRYHPDVNGWFLCDRGRFGYEFVNHRARIRQPRLLGSAIPPEALAAWLGDGEAIGIGSPRASLEDNAALRRLVGPGRFFAGVSDGDHALLERVVQVLGEGPAPAASLREVEASDAVLVLGEDVTATAPRLALALRQAARRALVEEARAALHVEAWQDEAVRVFVGDRVGPFFVATPAASALDEVARAVHRAAPDDLARLGHAVAHAIDGDAPSAEVDGAPVTQIALALRAAARPLVVAGTGCGSVAVVEAAAHVARALCRQGRPARIALVVPECNSLGLALLGAPPLSAAMSRPATGTVIVLANDLYRRAPAAEVSGWLEGADHVAVLDVIETDTTAGAALVLPLASFAEATGTLVSNEGRAQRFVQVFVPTEPILSGWRWLQRLSGRLPRWSGVEALLADLEEDVPALRGARDALPSATWRHAGSGVPREPRPSSGRTTMELDTHLREPARPGDPDSPLAFSMEGTVHVPAALRPFALAPGWHSELAVLRAGEARGGVGGQRLIAPGPGTEGWPYQPPAPFAPAPGQWLVVEAQEVFGTEELSAHGAAVAARTPAPWLGLGPVDASALGVVEGTRVGLHVADRVLELPVRVEAGLVPGLARLPRHLPGLRSAWGLRLPSLGRVAVVSP